MCIIHVFLAPIAAMINNKVLPLWQNCNSRTMKSIFNKNVTIAITIIASLCLLYWGIEYLKGINLFKPANFYYAHFENVHGLVTAAPVTVNGFPVGQVHSLEYDYSNNKIKVLLSMNKGLQIPTGSSISLESSLTGTASLALTLGQSNVYLHVGDSISSVPKYGLMDRVNNEVFPQVTQILPKVDSIMGNVNELTGSPALAASLARLDAITAELARSSQQLTLLMNRLNQSVPGVMNNVNGITSNLTGTTQNLNEFSSSLKSMPIDSTINGLNATIANMQELTKKLNSKDSSLGLLLNDKSLYQNADNAVASLDSLLTDIKKNPKRYVTIKVF